MSIILVLLLTLVLSFLTGAYALSRRGIRGALLLGGIFFVQGGLLLGQLMEFNAITLEEKVHWDIFCTAGMVLLPFLWLEFALIFSGQVRRSSVVLLGGWFAIGVLLVGVIVVQELWGDLRADATLVTFEGLQSVTYAYSIWDWFVVLYFYASHISSFLILLRYAARISRALSRQLTLITIGLFLPNLALPLIFVGTGISGHQYILMYAGLISSFLISWSLYRYRLLDVIPVAREAVLERMEEAVLVVDQKNRVIDLNPAARALPWLQGADLLWQPLPAILRGCAATKSPQGARQEICVEHAGATFFYEVSCSSLHAKASDYIFVLHDVTRRKVMESELLQERAHLEQRVLERTDELAQNERKFRALVEQSSEGFVIIDQDGKIVEWNMAQERMTHIPRSEVVGVFLWDVMAQVMPAEHFSVAYVQKIRQRVLSGLASGQIEWFQMPYEVMMNKANQEKVVLQQTVFPVRMDHVWWLGAITRDVTAMHNEQLARERAAERAEALARLATRLNSDLSLPVVLANVCEEAVKVLDVSAAAIRLYNPEHAVFDYVASSGLEGVNPEQLTAVGEAQISVELNSTIDDIGVIRDVTTWDHQTNPALYASLDVRSLAFARLRYRERMVGLLSVYVIGQVRDFLEDDLHMLRTFSHQAAIAIYNANLFEQVRASSSRLERLSKRLMDIQESERRYLATELHDEIGQLLTQLKMTLERTDPSRAGPTLGEGIHLVQSLMNQVRSLSLELRPAILDDLGLLPALLWHLERYQGQTGMRVEFSHHGISRRFRRELETSAYRIIQEALTNAARYASGCPVTVSVWADDERLGLQVEDGGPGFNVNEALATHSTGGISGMRERAELCGGQLTVDSTPGVGTYISVEFPITIPGGMDDDTHRTGG